MRALDLAPLGGFVANSTLPARWGWWSEAGLSFEAAGTGQQDGIAYVDIHIFGTPSATTGANQIFLAGRNEITAKMGQLCALSVQVALIAGSASNLRSLEIAANLNDNHGRYSSWLGSKAFMPEGAGLAYRRYRRRIDDAQAAFVQPLLQIGSIAGRPLDIILRIADPRAGLLAPVRPELTSAA
jgi:hypothetical protein